MFVLHNSSGMFVSKTISPTAPTLAGVISTAPGYRIMSNKKGWHPVALAGRVPVKISLENGPICIGDYLTSSSISGVAMKATKPGRVIGQALEAYDRKNKSNKILSFVNAHFWDGNVIVKVQEELSTLKQEKIILEKELATLKETMAALQKTVANLESAAGK